MKRIILILSLILIPYEVQAQTPQVLRVNIDATGALVAIGSAQTLPLTSCLFSNCRLAVDASGNLKIVLVGGTVTSPIFAPTQSSCSTVSYSFTGRTTTGLNSHAADTWNLCGGGTLGLSGNTTDVTSSLPLTITEGTITTDRPIFNGTTTWNAAGVTFNGLKLVITDTSSAAGALPVNILGGAAGSTPLFTLGKTGIVTAPAFIATGASGFTTPSTSYFTWSTRTVLKSPADGQVLLTNAAETDFSRLQFGGTTSSFPAIKRNSTGIDVRLADDSAYTAVNAASFLIASSGGSLFVGTNKVIINTAPTISSGFGTSPSIVASNGSAAFTINVGTGGTASSGVIGLPTATTGWACRVENLTANAANRANQRTLQTATTTTTVTIQNQTISTGAALAWTASDIVQLMCLAY